MKKVTNITILLLMGIIFTLPNILSCGKSIDTGHPIYGVTGIIKDITTHQPIDSAWIDLDSCVAPYWTYTDSNGEYSFFFYVSLDNQKTIIAGKDGYESFDTTINISVPQYILDTINILLIPE